MRRPAQAPACGELAGSLPLSSTGGSRKAPASCAFAQPGLLLLAGGLTIAAIIGKMTCAVAVGRGVDRWAVALGMVPRGEVQLVYATLGTGLLLNGRPVVGTETYAAIVAVVLVTTLVAPPLLRIRLLKE